MLQKITQKLNTIFELDTRKILGRASYLLGSQAFSNLLSFGVAVTAAHFLSKDTYGTYRYILSTVSFIGAFSLTGLSTAIIRETARGYDHLYRNSIEKSLKWSIPSILIGIGVGLWYLIHGNIILGFSITVGGILFPFIQSLLLFRSYLNGKESFKALMLSNIFYSSITSGVLIVTLFFKPSVVTLVYAYYISNIVATAILSFVIKKYFKPNNNLDSNSQKLEHHMSIMNILDTGATQLDKVLLFQIAGPVEVARYVFATIIPEQLRNIVKYTSTLSLPIFSNLPKETSRSKALFLAKKLFLITLPVVVLYYIFAPLIYKVFFPSYIEVIGYSQLFALILLFDGGITGTALKAQGEIKKIYLVNISANITKVALLVALGITMGIWGVILSRIISRMISFFVSYIALERTQTHAGK